MYCNHDKKRLCDLCRAEYDDDPETWLEYGDHPAGDENYRRALDELAAFASDDGCSSECWDDVPF